MKRIFISLLMLFLTAQFVFAQPSQADIDKMMKQSQEQLKKMVGSDTSRDKMRKNLQDQQKQLEDQQKKLLEGMKDQPSNNKTTPNESLYADPSDYGNVDNWKFPPKNIALLSSLPKKIFAKPELINFLNDIYSQLSKKLPGGITSSVQSIAAKYNNDGNKMGDAAVTGWYTNYREESLLLIIKAAANNPDNGLLLNNCAAILNMSGIEQKAIPILKYILQTYPESSMVLNNLGQAYAGLGETDTAMIYLGRCIKIEPENTEANNTAGQVEATKGHTEKAIAYFEQSIKGGYNKTAELKLRKIKKNSSIVSFVRPRVKIPEYFNLFKYKFPAQCTSIYNATIAEAEYEAFRKTISAQREKYLKIYDVLGLKVVTSKPPIYSVTKNLINAAPFHEYCGIMIRDLFIEFGDNLGVYDKKYNADIALLEKEYQNKYDSLKKDFIKREEEASRANCCREGNVSCCIRPEEKQIAFDELSNQYLPKFAVIREDFQEKNMVFFKKYFDELMYWGYLADHFLGDDYFRVKCFYPVVIYYLDMLIRAGTTKIIKPYLYEPSTAATFDSLAIKEMECPLDIVVPLFAAKIQLNCETFSISGGEGIVFGYEKKFKTHQSTLTAGIGFTLELQEKVGPVKAGVKATATETVFITFDGNNGIADVGLKNEAKVSASAPGVGKKEIGVGSTLGINSGYNFTPGPFKDAPEVQQNKNVNIYKPKYP